MLYKLKFTNRYEELEKKNTSHEKKVKGVAACQKKKRVCGISSKAT